MPVTARAEQGEWKRAARDRHQSVGRTEHDDENCGCGCADSEQREDGEPRDQECCRETRDVQRVRMPRNRKLADARRHLCRAEQRADSDRGGTVHAHPFVDEKHVRQHPRLREHERRKRAGDECEYEPFGREHRRHFRAFDG